MQLKRPAGSDRVRIAAAVTFHTSTGCDLPDASGAANLPQAFGLLAVIFYMMQQQNASKSASYIAHYLIQFLVLLLTGYFHNFRFYHIFIFFIRY